MNIDPAIFNLLLQALKKNKEIHLNIVWGTLAFQVAAIGWLITSEQARGLFGLDNTLGIVGTIAVVMLALAHYVMLYDTYAQSEKLAAAMESNEYFQKVLLNETLTFSYFSNRPDQAHSAGDFYISPFWGANFYVLVPV